MKANVTPLKNHKYNMEAEKSLNTIGSRIKEARKAKDYSLDDLRGVLEGCGVKVSRYAINKWETGETVPSAYQLIAICNALGLTEYVSYFMDSYMPELNSEGLRKVQDYRADLIATGKYAPAPKKTGRPVIRYIDMKVSNLAVSAGTGEFLDEGNYDIISFPESSVPQGADFGVRVAGDSMEPVYHDGQIVWVHECDRVDVGQVGVFVYDGAGYLKAYSEQEPDESVVEEYTDSEGNVYAQPVLLSYNQKYDPRVINPGAAFQVVGRVL